MDLQTLQAIIEDAGGEANVLGFMFDNSARKFFGKGFKLSNYLVPGTEILKFVDKETKGISITTYKPISCIQSVLTVEDESIKERLDDASLRYISF